jgi:hypothetical protein
MSGEGRPLARRFDITQRFREAEREGFLSPMRKPLEMKPFRTVRRILWAVKKVGNVRKKVEKKQARKK